MTKEIFLRLAQIKGMNEASNDPKLAPPCKGKEKSKN